METYRYGKQQLEQQAIDGEAYPHSVNVHHLVLDPVTAWRIQREKDTSGTIADEFATLEALTKQALALVDAKPIDRWLVTKRGDGTTIGMTIAEMGEVRLQSYETTYSFFVMQENKAVALNKFSRLLNSVLAKAYASGYNAGSSLINRLAKGDLTIDQLNKEELKRK